MKTSTALNQTALWSLSCYLCALTVCVPKKGGVKECTQQIDFLWPHSQFIYLLYYSAPMSFSVPWRVRTFRGNFDKTDPPLFLSLTALLIFSYFVLHSFPHFLQIEGVKRSNRDFFYGSILFNGRGFNNIWKKEPRRERYYLHDCSSVIVWLTLLICESTVCTGMCSRYLTCLSIGSL